MESVSAMDVSVLTFSPPVTRSSFPIPDDLVFEIFSRLPSKAIARCCCVSKLWASILRSQDFTEFFLSKSFAHPQLLLIFEDDREIVFFSSPQPENPEENSYVVATNHLASFPGSEYGCTSGFLCYGVSLIMNGMGHEVICNPSTGQSLILPDLKRGSQTSLRATYHGYDPISKKFKELKDCHGGWSNVASHIDLIISGYVSMGVLYYMAAAKMMVECSNVIETCIVICFDLRTEKFTVINVMETFNRALPRSTTMVNYNGKLGLLMRGDSGDFSGASPSFELWVLRDAENHEWSKHVYVLPPSSEDVFPEVSCIAGMVGTNEIVLSPCFQKVPYYVIYYNVERKTIKKVGIRGLEAFQGKSFKIYLNYVENVELI